MTKKLHLLSFLILQCLLAEAQTTLWQEDFESDGNGSTYTATNEFQDSTNDYFRRVDGSISVGTSTSPDCGTYNGQSKNFYWACEDTDDSCNTPTCNTFGNTDALDFKSITFNQIDTSGFTNFIFKGLFAAGSNCNGTFQYDFNDGAVISYSTDGGINYTQALKFRYDNANDDSSNEQLGVVTTINQSCLISTGDGGFAPCNTTETPIGGSNIATYLSTSFQEFDFSIPGTPSTVDIKIELSFNSAGEEFAFDNFRLEGNNNSALSIDKLQGSKKTISVYPNPTNKELFIENLNQEVKASIYAISGEKINELKLNKSINSVNVYDLKNGVYFLKIKENSIKFIKK